MIIKTDKDFCLVAVKAQSKLNITAINNEFKKIVKERKSDQNGIFSLIYHKNFQKNAIEKLRGENPEKSKKLDANTSLISTSFIKRSTTRSEAGMSLKRIGTFKGSVAQTEDSSLMKKATMSTSVAFKEEIDASNTYYKDFLIVRYRD